MICLAVELKVFKASEADHTSCRHFLSLPKVKKSLCWKGSVLDFPSKLAAVYDAREHPKGCASRTTPAVLTPKEKVKCELNFISFQSGVAWLCSPEQLFTSTPTNIKPPSLKRRVPTILDSRTRRSPFQLFIVRSSSHPGCRKPVAPAG